jgi:hypothetical protein
MPGYSSGTIGGFVKHFQATKQDEATLFYQSKDFSYAQGDTCSS